MSDNKRKQERIQVNNWIYEKIKKDKEQELSQNYNVVI